MKTSPVATLTTVRLILRGWRESDLLPLAQLNADPAVMQHFPAPLERQASDALARRFQQRLERGELSAWAVERRDTGEFIGFVGLSTATFEAPFTPCVEAAWRLAAAHWRQGFATEAAMAALRYGYGELGLAEVVAFTAVGNHPSRRVMEKLGMARDPAEDFDHSRLPPGHRLRRHVLYRLSAARWRSMQAVLSVP